MALALSVLTGFFMVLPQLLTVAKLSANYKGISIDTGDQEIHYVARVQEIYDGHFKTGNTFVSDLKNKPYLQPPLPEMIISFFGKIFSLPAHTANDLAKFIFPAGLFFIVYYLIFSITDKKNTALFGASFLLLAVNLISILSYPFGRMLEAFINFSSFSRPVNPPISSLFFFGFLLLFWKTLEEKKYSYAIVSGAILGLSFYVYLYTWSYLYVFLGFLFIIYFVKKDYKVLKIILILVSISLIVAIPYLINLFLALSDLAYTESSMRFGMIASSEIIIGRLVPLLILFFVVLFPRKNKNLFYFFLSLVLTPLVVLNQQVITGHLMISSHYHWYIIKPLAILVFVLVFFDLLEKIKRPIFVKIASVTGIIVFVLVGFATQYYSYLKHLPILYDAQKDGSLMLWFNQLGEKNKTVFGDIGVTAHVAAYTPLDVYYNNNATVYLVSDERLKFVMFLDFKFQGISPESADKLFFGEKRKEVSSYLHGLYYREKCGDWICIPDEELRKLVSEYAIFFQGNLKEQIKKYPLDYIVWNRKQEPQRIYDRLDFLQKIYTDEFSGLEVYKVL